MMALWNLATYRAVVRSSDEYTFLWVRHARSEHCASRISVVAIVHDSPLVPPSCVTCEQRGTLATMRTHAGFWEHPVRVRR